MALKLIPTTPRCLACGQSPTENGEQLPAVDLGIDVNWGEDAHLCWNCSSLIADLLERVTNEEHDALKAEYKSVTRDYQRLSKRHIRLKKQVRAIEKGEKAKEAVKHV